MKRRIALVAAAENLMTGGLRGFVQPQDAYVQSIFDGGIRVLIVQENS
jgi:hypothetical protein